MGSGGVTARLLKRLRWGGRGRELFDERTGEGEGEGEGRGKREKGRRREDTKRREEKERWNEKGMAREKRSERVGLLLTAEHLLQLVGQPFALCIRHLQLLRQLLEPQLVLCSKQQPGERESQCSCAFSAYHNSHQAGQGDPRSGRRGGRRPHSYALSAASSRRSSPPRGSARGCPARRRGPSPSQTWSGQRTEEGGRATLGVKGENTRRQGQIRAKTA